MTFWMGSWRNPTDFTQRTFVQHGLGNLYQVEPKKIEDYLIFVNLNGFFHLENSYFIKSISMEPRQQRLFLIPLCETENFLFFGFLKQYKNSNFLNSAKALRSKDLADCLRKFYNCQLILLFIDNLVIKFSRTFC